MGGTDKGSVGGKKGYIYPSSGDFLVQLVRHDTFDSYSVFCWLMNTKRPSCHFTQPPGASWMTSIETRFSTHGADRLQRRALLLHRIPPVPLRPRASRSTQCSSQVVPTVKTSNTATITPSGEKSTPNLCLRIENTSLFDLRCFQLWWRRLPTGKRKIYTINGSKYCAKNECNTMIIVPRRHKHP